MTQTQIRAFLSEIGKKGGHATGASKIRGGGQTEEQISAYYKRLSRKAVKARKEKARRRASGEEG